MHVIGFYPDFFSILLYLYFYTSILLLNKKTYTQANENSANQQTRDSIGNHLTPRSIIANRPPNRTSKLALIQNLTPKKNLRNSTGATVPHPTYATGSHPAAASMARTMARRGGRAQQRRPRRPLSPSLIGVPTPLSISDCCYRDTAAWI